MTKKWISLVSVLLVSTLLTACGDNNNAASNQVRETAVLQQLKRTR